MAHQLNEKVTLENAGRYTREAIFALADKHGVPIFQDTRDHTSYQGFPHLAFNAGEICSISRLGKNEYFCTIEEFCARIAGEWVDPKESPEQKELRELKARIAELESKLNK